MKYGGLLHDINFNKAPRFQEGGDSNQIRQSSGMSGMGGMKTGAVSGAAMAIGMVTSMAGLPPAINNVIMGFSALTGVMSAFQMIMMKNNATAAAGSAGGASTFFQRGAAKQKVGKQGLRVGAKMGGARGAGIAAQGAGRLAMGALMTGPGLIAVAAVGAIALAVIKWRKEVDEAKKATQQAFSVGAKTAQAYGIELTKIGDKLKENAEITKRVGINSSQITSTMIVDEEKKAAILEDNAQMIADLKEKEKGIAAIRTNATRTAIQAAQANPTNSAETTAAIKESADKAASNVANQSKAQLLTKYASLRQQGVSAQDANEIITTIARDAGDETISALIDIKPTLEKMNGDNFNEVFKAAQQAQLNGLKDMATSGMGGQSGAFKEAMKASMDVIQYAPPEDQLAALNNLITNMKGFDASQIKLAGEALAEAAAVTYGTKSDIGASLQSLFKSGDAKQIETGLKLDTLMKANALTANQVIQIGLAIKEGEIDKVNSIINPILKDKNIKVNMVVEMEKNAQKRIEEINKEITEQQALFDGQMIANENAVEAENNRYENAQKAHEKFIKQKQDEIEAINKSADAYIKALQDEQRADSFAQQQRDTATGGLKALASGDVFGFVQSQQEMAGAAQQFGFESEIKAIDERRQAAVDAKEEQIKKEQELAATEDERHQNRLKGLEAQRIAHIKANGDIMKGFQAQQAALTEISTFSGTAFTGITEGFATVDVEANKVGATGAAVDFLLANPDATVEQAIAEGRKFMEQNAQSPGSNYREVGVEAYAKHAKNQYQGPSSGGENKNYAFGGYVSGAGGPKADLIPARLSNGEYVVQASAVDEYGVDMMDSINEQNFADGGFVSPTRSGIKGGNPYGVKKNYYSLGFHTGQDYEANLGDDILSVAAGKVISANYAGALGNLIAIQHADGIRTYYAHLSKILKRKGEVEKGEPIGYAGFTGNVIPNDKNGTHLHFEARRDPYTFKADSFLNPNKYLSGASDIGGEQQGSDTGSETASTGLSLKTLDKIATSMGTTAEVYTKVKTEGLASLVARRFGGSMTMNKPYMVGENGPEVVMPYGSGGRVVPIKYNVPAMASGGIMNGSMASSSPQINVTVNGVNDPKQAADRAAQLINSEMNRRKFSRSIG
jgi:murein DD-endopeptidase MepM/ murein hydrolase activator NlpD